MNVNTTPALVGTVSDRVADGRKLAVVYECRVKWAELQATDNDHVRYCANCSQPVFQVTDAGDFQRGVAASRCVMVRIDHTNCLRPALQTYYAPIALEWDDECDSERAEVREAREQTGPSRDLNRWFLAVQPSVMETKVIDWRFWEPLSWD